MFLEHIAGIIFKIRWCSSTKMNFLGLHILICHLQKLIIFKKICFNFTDDCIVSCLFWVQLLFLVSFLELASQGLFSLTALYFTDTLSVCSNDSIMPGSSATLQPGHGIGSHTSPGPKRPGEIANLYLKGFEKNLFKKKSTKYFKFQTEEQSDEAVNCSCR